MTATETTDVYYDPYDVDIDADPYPVFRRLREEAPLYYNEPYDFFAVSRFDDVERGLVDAATYISGRGGILELIKANMEMPPGILIFEDPPTHTIHRGLLSRVFTPKQMNALEPRIRQFCVDSLDRLDGADRFDFVADLGAQMPMRVIGMLLGIPEEDQESIREYSDASLRTKPGQPQRFSGEFRERRAVRRVHRLAGRSPVRRPHDPAAERRIRGRDRGHAPADAAPSSSPT